MTESAKDELRKDLETLREDVQRIAETVRVRVHLAGMEAKDAWNQVQPQLEDFERQVESKASNVGKELHELGTDVRSRLQKIRGMLSPDKK